MSDINTGTYFYQVIGTANRTHTDDIIVQADNAAEARKKAIKSFREMRQDFVPSKAIRMHAAS